MLKNKTFIAVFIKCLLMPINAGTMLNKGRNSYLLHCKKLLLIYSIFTA